MTVRERPLAPSRSVQSCAAHGVLTVTGRSVSSVSSDTSPARSGRHRSGERRRRGAIRSADRRRSAIEPFQRTGDGVGTGWGRGGDGVGTEWGRSRDGVGTESLSDLPPPGSFRPARAEAGAPPIASRRGAGEPGHLVEPPGASHHPAQASHPRTAWPAQSRGVPPPGRDPRRRSATLRDQQCRGADGEPSVAPLSFVAARAGRWSPRPAARTPRCDHGAALPGGWRCRGRGRYRRTGG